MTTSRNGNNEFLALQERIREQERELLRERDVVIGLEAQIKQLADGHLVDALRGEVSRLEASGTYRVGRLVTSPVRFVARLFKSLRRKTVGVVRRVRPRHKAR